LTKKLGDFTGDVIDEVDFAFRKNWGVSTTEWEEVTLYDTMLDVIGRVSNRVLVGVPLCKSASKFSIILSPSDANRCKVAMMNSLMLRKPLLVW
jgi:hypothetical protein